VCVAAERGVLIALEGDCKTPIAAFAERAGDALHLRAFVCDPDGANLRRDERTLPWPSEQIAHDAGFAMGRALKPAPAR
jgi:hydroxymethylbilane synthase